jgi:hypothetical protein
MDILHQHEIFEIEVLDHLKRARILEPLVFGGGTMLRLCHELNRHSVDLDFWFIKTIPQDAYFDQIVSILAKNYTVTDAQIKHYTLLFELRSALYPKRLKIEIRKEIKECDFQEKIAFSRFSTRQVLLKAHTLGQSMKNKIEAFLDRGEIRDCFDIEFLLRRGVALPKNDAKRLHTLHRKLSRFKDIDFKVKLGSILESDARAYYVANRFKFLEEKLTAALSVA